jgi:hypothetical protein
MAVVCSSGSSRSIYCCGSGCNILNLFLIQALCVVSVIGFLAVDATHKNKELK